MEQNGVLRKGTWTPNEDNLLISCMQRHGEGHWSLVPERAGLNRCKRSCRMRWLNYLKPDLKKGEFMDDEVDLIRRLHKLLGNRWSLIAGRLPGRTANDVKNYWIRNQARNMQVPHQENATDADTENMTRIFKPRPYTLSQRWYGTDSHIKNLSNLKDGFHAPETLWDGHLMTNHEVQ